MNGPGIRKVSYAGPFLKGSHPPIASPSDIETRPHAVGLGMKFALTAARKKNRTAMPKKILPTRVFLKLVSIRDSSHIHIRRVPARVT